MKTVSIFEKRWIDLVFEGKNKAYGAYQLRQENSKTTAIAFLFGLFFMTSVSGLGVLLSSFNSAPTPPAPIVTPVHLDKIHPNELKKEEPVKKEVQKETTKAPEESVLKNPIVAKETNTDIVKNVDLPKNPTSETGNPSDGPTNLPPTTGNSEGEPKTPFKGIASKGILDQQPEFPGGIDKFYKYVAQNFEKPEDFESGNTIKVVVSFVIEPDGRMTNIVVARDPGYGLADEAVRVLKSLKTKWKAGVIDGEFVRTAYSLPIVLDIK